jgi:hypothetical protein
MQHMLKSHILSLNHKVWARPKRQVQDGGIDGILDWHKIGGAQNLIDHDLA